MLTLAVFVVFINVPDAGSCNYAIISSFIWKSEFLALMIEKNWKCDLSASEGLKSKRWKIPNPPFPPPPDFLSQFHDFSSLFLTFVDGNTALISYVYIPQVIQNNPYYKFYIECIIVGTRFFSVKFPTYVSPSGNMNVDWFLAF